MVRFPKLVEFSTYSDWIYDICCIEDKEERLDTLYEFIELVTDRDKDIFDIDIWTDKMMGKSFWWEKKEELDWLVDGVLDRPLRYYRLEKERRKI